MLTELWMTKYRPKTIDDIVLPENVKEQIKNWIRKGSIPNLLLIGPPGTGKTSLANVIKHSMNVEMLVLNGSEKRGIDIIRNEILSFALAGTYKLKIVFIDEADGLTVDAQQSLRNIIETYSNNTRFIFTANYDKFIQPLKDRFTIIYFDKLTKEDIENIVKKILDNENIMYKPNDLKYVINALYPSLRSIIQTLQTNIIEIENKKVLKLTNIVKSNDLEIIETIIKLFKANQIDEIRKIIDENNITDFTELYRKFFYNLNDAIAKLIVSEYMYRDKLVADKEINFIAMLYALQLKALPMNLINYPDPSNKVNKIETVTNTDNSITIQNKSVNKKHDIKENVIKENKLNHHIESFDNNKADNINKRNKKENDILDDDFLKEAIESYEPFIRYDNIKQNNNRNDNFIDLESILSELDI